jgi:Ti-type conjugative transfer relaxase TraA
MTPENAPVWAKDREKLWNAVEASEKRKDSQLAREVEISLPREFSTDQNIALVKEFAQKEFVDKGMIADVCLHYGMKGGEYNPHAHILLTMREVTEEGFGKKNVEWNKKELLKEWRQSWCELSNKHLSLNGFDIQIDHRTLKEQGIELSPQNVELPNDAKERLSEQSNRQLEIMRQNGERLLEKPEIALKAITQMQATFTDRDIARYVHSRTSDTEQYNAVYEKIRAHDGLVRLVADKEARYTTKEMLGVEMKMMGEVMVKTKENSHNVKDEGLKVLKEVVDSRELSIEQKTAVEYVTQSKGISCIVGYAGTGKTHMLKTAKEVWEKSGYNVKGGALSGIAAQGLENGAGIESRTVARRLIDWENGRDQLSKRDIFVVDEAGMLGTKDVARIVSEVNKRGAKLLLVGDPQQLQAIEAGAAFRGIAEKIGYLEMNNIRRQELGWQREVTRMLAVGNVGDALDVYNNGNKIHFCETKEIAMAEMVQNWMADKELQLGGTEIMLTYKRGDVKSLNEMARSALKQRGMLDKGHELALSNGVRELSIKDRVYFLRNDNGLEVRNGTLGELVSVNKEGEVKIRIVENYESREIAFNINKYNYLDHGYAATVHKAQGVTVNKAYVMASRGFNQHITYVAMSRHIGDLELYWSKDEFSSFSDFKNQLGKEGRKDNAMDYEASAIGFAEGRGIASKDMDIAVKQDSYMGAGKLEEWLDKHGKPLTKEAKDSTYKDMIDKLERNRVLNDGMKELSKKYNCKISNDLKLGEKFRYRGTEKIAWVEYGLLKAYGKNEMKIIKQNRCMDLKVNNEAEISKFAGVMVAMPSAGELWDRKVEPLRKELGKAVSFKLEAGDKGRYGGTVEFEGKEYGIMQQSERVKLIEKEHCAPELKKGDYIKMESSRNDIKQSKAVVDTVKQKEVEMEKQQEQSKGLELER